jgi:hypothetical protein
MLDLIPYFEGKKKILEKKVTKFQTWKMENTKLLLLLLLLFWWKNKWIKGEVKKYFENQM